MLLRKSSYRRKIHRYLRSPVWAARSRAFRQLARFRCFGCGLVSIRNHAHHLSYAHAFHGREPSSDLMCLCSPCHVRVHSYARRHPELSLRMATFAALGRRP